MNKFLKFSFVAVLFAGFAMLLNSCKKDFDAPPGPADPAIVANTTIAQLKTLHQTAGAYDIISSDLIIEGVVVANDRSGNLYKQIFIEDTTGGLQVALDAVNLFNTYPVGRKIFIRCKDLCITDFNNTPQLGVKATVAGVPSFEGIPGSLISKYVVGGSINNPVTPHVISYNELKASSNGLAKPWFNRYLNTLIQLDSMAFVNLNKSYSDTSAYKATVNRGIRNCTATSNADSIIVRNSAYANFAGKSLPTGRGKITSIFTVFGTTRQLLLRDSTDVQFTNPYACPIAPPPPLPPGVLLDETFESQNTPGPLVLFGWFSGAEVGTRTFEGRTFNANKYAQMTANASNEASTVGWLVTRAINLGTFTNKILTFETIAGFQNGATLKVLVSSNYTGTGNPWAGGVTWTDITAQAALSPGLPTGYPTNFTPSGNISLNAYTGTIYIAFKYEGGDLSGTANDKTTTWQVDNVKVTGN